MKVYKYFATSNLVILDKLLLTGDEVYITESFTIMNGKFDYARKVFDVNKNYLGMIRNDLFASKIKSQLKELEV